MEHNKSLKSFQKSTTYYYYFVGCRAPGPKHRRQLHPTYVDYDKLLQCTATSLCSRTQHIDSTTSSCDEYVVRKHHHHPTVVDDDDDKFFVVKYGSSSFQNEKQEGRVSSSTSIDCCRSPFTRQQSVQCEDDAITTKSETYWDCYLSWNRYCHHRIGNRRATNPTNATTRRTANEPFFGQTGCFMLAAATLYICRSLPETLH